MIIMFSFDLARIQDKAFFGEPVLKRGNTVLEIGVIPTETDLLGIYDLAV